MISPIFAKLREAVGVVSTVGVPVPIWCCLRAPRCPHALPDSAGWHGAYRFGNTWLQPRTTPRASVESREAVSVLGSQPGSAVSVKLGFMMIYLWMYGWFMMIYHESIFFFNHNGRCWSHEDKLQGPVTCWGMTIMTGDDPPFTGKKNMTMAHIPSGYLT